MAFQRVTLSNLRSRLLSQLGSTGVFWSSDEIDRAINEAIAVWQAMTGEKVITVSQAVTSTTANLVTLTTGDSAGRLLSALRVNVTGAPAMRELSVEEMDAGFYGWRTETASTTTQRPEYWTPVGIDKVFIYPRTGATCTLQILGYADATPLTSDSSYIDIDEGHIQRVLGFIQALLAFKQGVVEGTENATALRALFITAARERNVELLKTSLYKNYMGMDQGVSEPSTAEFKPQAGVRG